MADISRLSRLINGVQRQVDLSSNTLVVDNLKISMGNAFSATFSGSLSANRTITMPDTDVNLGDIATNSAKVSADGSVTTHSDVTDAGSGAIITTAERSKLAGIEAGATADQTGAEIKAAYEAEADTNAYTDAEKSKLAGIEAGAKDDQTGAEIKALYEAEANAFTDAQFTKLAGIEAGADVTDAANVAAAGAVMESDTSTASMSFVIDEDNMISDSATKVPTQQSVKAYVDAAVVGGVSYEGSYDASTVGPNGSALKGAMYTVTVAGNGGGFWSQALEIGDVIIAEIDSPASSADWSVVNKDLDAASIKSSYESNADTNAYTDAEKSKLAGIESGATADQTGAEIKALYEAEANAFTDAQFTKLAGIESGATADQTGAEIKAAYEAEADTNAFTDAEKSKLAGIESGATADQTGAEIKALYEAEANAFTDAQFTKLAGIEAGATADQNAAEVPYAGGDLTGTDVEAALDDAGSRILALENQGGNESVIESIAPASAIASGLKAVRFDGSGNLVIADNDASSSDNFYVIGLIISDNTTGAQDVYKHGKMTATSHGFTVGAPVYLGAAGVLTSTAPSAANDAVVKVGIARDANTIEVQIQVMGVN